MATWIKTTQTGVWYRENQRRKYIGKPDKYYAVKYSRNGKEVMEAVGWHSEGVTAQSAAVVRSKIVQNIRTGARPQSISEMRRIERERREAEERARQAEIERIRSEQAANVTFQEMFNVYIEHARETLKDQGKHAIANWNLLKPFFSGKPAKEVTVFDVDRARITLLKRRSPKTVHHAMSLIRTLYLRCFLWGLYTGPNPMKSVKFPKIDGNGRIRFLSIEEAQILLAELKPLNSDAHDLSLMSLFTCARYSELANLRWGAINWTDGFVTFLDTKNGRNRTVPICNPVREMLQDRLKALRLKGEPTPDSLVFPNRYGGVRSQMVDVFKVVADRLFNKGITDRRQRVVFHSLRHTGISWLVMNGTDLRTVQAISGHETLSMLKRYSHLSVDHVRDAVRRMADGFGDQSNLIPMSRQAG
ncbi:tyrosine-type recombinase/integrase [Desulfatirhabdium butyrativorans]|uniref:tyrosine-type recombinase/integrase n=1 Tax=Desulfatirhabdium butyrativorans TaxID=340467 RepID=UPI0004214E43|nr:site-specific integrase [Desulfatirhabdium butyrativorans]